MLKLTLCALALTATVAFADPAIVTHYDNGVLRVALEGSYAGAQYRVLRSDGAAADFTPVGPDEALDLRADPGVTYLYRFDLFFSDGSSARYGPYAVTVPALPLGVRLFPNPLRGAGQVELTLPGSRLAEPSFADVRVLDARGRTVRVLTRGEVFRGRTMLSWDGRDAAGRRLVPGAYFVRASGPLGTALSRFVSL